VEVRTRQPRHREDRPPGNGNDAGAARGRRRGTIRQGRCRSEPSLDPHRIDEAKRDEERRPRIHADLNRHERNIGREEAEEAEQNRRRRTQIAAKMGVPERGQGDSARNREDSVDEDVLPERQVQHVQRPIEQDRMHVARTDPPDLRERLRRDANRIALIKPNITVEGEQQKEDRSRNQQRDMRQRQRQNPLHAFERNRHAASLRRPEGS